MLLRFVADVYGTALLPPGRCRISFSPEKKMKVQAGIKTKKQAGKRASIGQASNPNRMKNGLSGPSVHTHFMKQAFYSAYTPSQPIAGPR